MKKLFMFLQYFLEIQFQIFFLSCDFRTMRRVCLLTFLSYCHQEKFILKKYMDRQTDINSDMRAILVDWLVEVQVNLTSAAILFTHYSFTITRCQIC